MSGSGTARQTHGTHEAVRGRALTIALWVIQILLALQFVMAGLAALGLVCLMIGATLTNLFILGASPWLTIGLLVLGTLVAWGRWPQTRSLITGFGM